MGLDTVELVMAVEAEFGIDIPNEIASGTITLGDIRDFVILALKSRSEAVDPDDVWQRIKVIMRRDYAVRERHLVPEAEIVADLGLD